MSALTSVDRVRLVRILGLLGSDFVGERDNAARAAVRFLRERNIVWSDVIVSEASLHGPGPERARRPAAWREWAEQCAARPHDLRVWERGFIESLQQQQRLSRKQFAILKEIATRLHVAEAAP